MRKTAVIVLSLIMPLLSVAQKHGITFSTGYYGGINTKNNGSYANATFPNSITYSLGAGTLTNISYLSQLDSHFMFHAGLSYFEGNTTLVNRTLTSDSMSNYTGLTAWQLQARISVGYRVYIRKVQAYVNIGLVLPVMGRIKEESLTTDSGRQTAYTAIIRNKPGIGFTSSLGARVRISENISLFGEMQASLINISVNSKKITTYRDYQNRSLETVYPDTYDREIHYIKNTEDEPVNDKIVNPKGYDVNKPRETLSSKNPYSNMGFSIGLIFHF